MMHPERKVVLVAGTAEDPRVRGFCHGLARNGYALAFVNFGDREAADALLAEIATGEGDAALWDTDPPSSEAISAAVVGTAETMGGIDRVVYCGAGPNPDMQGKLLLDLDEEDWDGAMARGSKAFFLLCKYALPYLISRPGADILLLDPMPAACETCSLSEYVASAAMEAAVRHLATELAQYGIAATHIRTQEIADWDREAHKGGA